MPLRFNNIVRFWVVAEESKVPAERVHELLHQLWGQSSVAGHHHTPPESTHGFGGKERGHAMSLQQQTDRLSPSLFRVDAVQL